MFSAVRSTGSTNVWIAAAMAASVWGCKKSVPPREGESKSQAVPQALEVDASASMANPPLGSPDEPRFSLPIAATLGEDDHVIVVGLDAAAHKLRLVDVSYTGKVRYRVDVMSDVEWSDDAVLRVTSSGREHVVVYRGTVGNKRGAHASLVDASGKVERVAEAISATHCVAGDVVTMLEPKTKRVTMLSLRSRQRRTFVPRTRDRDLSLFCDAREALLLGEGESDFSAEPLPVTDVSSLVDAGSERVTPLRGDLALVFSERELGTEAREQVALFSRDGAAGFLRVGRDNDLMFRSLSKGELSAVVRVKEKLGQDEDVVHADGTMQSLVLVALRDTERTCDAGVASAEARALEVTVAGGSAAWIDLAPASCTREHGPFFSGILAGGTPFVYFAERSKQSNKTIAPVTALAYRAFRPGETTRVVSVSADGIVDAGCRGNKCYTVALARPAGSDDSRPEPIRVIAIP